MVSKERKNPPYNGRKWDKNPKLYTCMDHWDVLEKEIKYGFKVGKGNKTYNGGKWDKTPKLYTCMNHQDVLAKQNKYSIDTVPRLTGVRKDRTTKGGNCT